MTSTTAEVSHHTLEIEVPSSMQEISTVLNHAKHFFKQHDTPINIMNQNSVVIRELLVNAIKHGHNHNESKHVKVCIDFLKDSQFIITVEDEGPGFDTTFVERLSAGQFSLFTNRGYILVKALTEKISFNATGNSVSVKTLPVAYGAASKNQTEAGQEQ